MGRFLKMNDKERDFCLVYLSTRNACEAYRQAMAKDGTSDATVKAAAHKVLKRPAVAHFLATVSAEVMAQEVEAGTDLMREGLEALRRGIDAGMTEIIDANGNKVAYLPGVAVSAAKELIRIHQSDHDGSIKLARLKLLHDLAEKGKLTDSELSAWAGDVLNVRQ